jgi:nucleoid-associated protein YgaU
MGLKLQNLTVNVEGDKVTLSGMARSQEEREKAILLVGNTQGIAKVDDRITIAAAAPPTMAGGDAGTTVKASTTTGAETQAHFYTVEKGDSLSKIAQRFYGNANQYDRIFEANRPMLKDPDEIYPGQVLRIPGVSSATHAGTTQPRPGARV